MIEYQNLSEYSQPPSLRGRSKFIVQMWWIFQATLFRWSPRALFGWRNLLLRLFGAKIGSNVRIRSSVNITYPWKLEIGNSCWVGDDCFLYNLDHIKIGNNVALAHGVYISTGEHDYTKKTFDIKLRPVVIEEQAWLANDVFIAPGVTIGKGAVIGARSTVLKDMPEGMVCVGYPAKPLKPRIDKK